MPFKVFFILFIYLFIEETKFCDSADKRIIMRNQRAGRPEVKAGEEHKERTG